MNAGWFQFLESLMQRGENFVVIHLTAGRGHIPQDVGAKAVVGREGLLAGTVGGGKVEAKAIAHAQGLLRGEEDLPRVLTWNLQRDVGMTCGGEASFYFEVHRPRTWSVAVFGAGHVGQALVRVLAPLSCHVTCVESRQEWLDRLPASENLDVLQRDEPAQAVASLPDATFLLSVMQGHAHDVPILAAALQRGTFPYVGVIGSVTKGLRIRAELREQGFSDEQTKSIHCPMGLPIGDHSPEEIALSIVAQVLQVRGRERPEAGTRRATSSNNQLQEPIL